MEIENLLNFNEADMPLVSRLLHQLIDEKYRALLDESSEPMCITDRSGKFICVNKKMADSLGFTKKELLGLSIENIITQESGRAFMDSLKEFLKTGKAGFQNFVLKTKFGGTLAGELKATAFYNHNGKYNGMKAVLKNQTLEDYYKKIHAIMEHAVEGVLELGPDNTIEFVNKGFLEMTGYAQAELSGGRLSDFMPPEDAVRLASVKLIRRVREMTFIKKDGSFLYALVSSIPLAFKGVAARSLCFISDLTETKTAAQKLKDANLTLRALNDSLLDLSLRDARTGIYNYRYLNERLTEELKRAKRYFRPFSLIMMDIDFFKAINDSYGHLYGDVILKEFTELLKKCVRETDVLIRSGGEEFMVFLPDTPTSGALTVAAKITQTLARTALGDEDKKVKITVSLGVTSYPESGAGDAAGFLGAADQAMYQSKARGRNLITVSNKDRLQSETQSRGAAGEDYFSYNSLRGRLNNTNARHEESIMETLMPMVQEVYRRMEYGAGFLERLLVDVETLAASFGLPAGEIQRLRRAAAVCNLGLLSVPERALAKEGALTQEERLLIQQHPMNSFAVIRDISFFAPAAGDILCHHERFDGAGYPRGIQGQDLPLGARIIFLAETFQALLNPRPYRLKAWTAHAALDFIQQESGRAFCPVVVEHYLHLSKI